VVGLEHAHKEAVELEEDEGEGAEVVHFFGEGKVARVERG